MKETRQLFVDDMLWLRSQPSILYNSQDQSVQSFIQSVGTDYSQFIFRNYLSLFQTDYYRFTTPIILEKIMIDGVGALDAISSMLLSMCDAGSINNRPLMIYELGERNFVSEYYAHQ